MIYREDKYNNQISQLGYGCMRFSRKGANIDFDKAEKEIMLAYENGVNYYDTAYMYPGSEELLGKVLKKNNIRDKINIATKLPQFRVKNIEQVEKMFQEELRRLQTDHIDYYLMHMFTDVSEWNNLKNMGIEDWIQKHKEDNSIRQIGFSYHGETMLFQKLLEVYDWDFCQIQYNYLDEHSQAGVEGLEKARELHIPVVIMEPLRGGKLVNLPDKAMKLLKQNSKKYTPAELGLRWLYNQEGILTVLSGMNSLEMVKENTEIASSANIGDFTKEDFKLVDDIVKIFKEKERVSCTGCRYCMPCPSGVQIPNIFHFYNLMYMEKKLPARIEFIQSMGLRKDPGFATKCIGCGKCEKHCPQQIPIREKLKEADKHLRPMPIKIAISIAKKVIVKD